MGYFSVRYNSRVENYDRRGFIRLATGCKVILTLMTSQECICDHLMHISVDYVTVRYSVTRWLNIFSVMGD